MFTETGPGKFWNNVFVILGVLSGVIFWDFLAGPGPARARLSDSVRPKTPQFPHNVAIDVYGGQQGGIPWAQVGNM